MRVLALLLMLIEIMLIACAVVEVTHTGAQEAVTIDTKSMAKGVESYIVETRRYLHKHPEKSWEEYKTMQFIREEVTAMLKDSSAISQDLLQIERYDSEEHGEMGGIWYDISFKHLENQQNRVLFRADIDALMIEEETNLPFASVNQGVSHACGHDGHTAMLLGTLKAILNSHKGQVEIFKNNLRLLFQRAEEYGIPSGGYKLVNEFSHIVLKDISKAYGVHVMSLLPSGVFFSRPGSLLGCADYFKVSVECAGGHAGAPNQGVNAIRVINAMLSAIDTIAVRHLPTHEPSSLEPTNLSAGTGAMNIMAPKAELVCNCRNSLQKFAEREALMDNIERELRIIGSQFEKKNYGTVNVTFERFFSYPATVNDEKIFQDSKTWIEDEGYTVKTIPPMLAGEDFSYILEKVPGVYYMLGAQVENPADRFAHHTPKFNFNEEVLWMGAHYFLLIAASQQ